MRKSPLSAARPQRRLAEWRVGSRWWRAGGGVRQPSPVISGSESVNAGSVELNPSLDLQQAPSHLHHEAHWQPPHPQPPLPHRTHRRRALHRRRYLVVAISNANTDISNLSTCSRLQHTTDTARHECHMHNAQVFHHLQVSQHALLACPRGPLHGPAPCVPHRIASYGPLRARVRLPGAFPTRCMSSQ